MVEKRRDDKGRVLRQGEFQRPDGSYEYKYTDLTGKRCSVYSWKLVETDKTPAGKRVKEALRTLEKQIEKDVEDGIINSKITLNDYFERYMKTRKDLRGSTYANNLNAYDKHIRNTIGIVPISNITYGMVKTLFIDLAYNKHLKINTINVIKGVINPIFKEAKKENLIKENFVPDIFSDIRRRAVTPEKRKGLTTTETHAFLDCIKHNRAYKQYLPLITFLLGTGCRIGETLALRWQDCDFDDNLIYIKHNLSEYSIDGVSVKKIHDTKTDSGRRTIPMLKEVRDALCMQKKFCIENGFNTETIDGYEGFVFRSLYRPKTLRRGTVFAVIKAITQIYNNNEKYNAKIENRKPILLPENISPHTFRHTFCTRFCENETNLKVIQEIMGHSDISVTMNIYNEATKEKKEEAFKNLENKMEIS